MKNYYVEVSSYVPYPIKKTYTIKRSSFGAAISEAVKSYRKDLGRKHLKVISVRAEML